MEKFVKPFYGVGYALLIAAAVAAVVLFSRHGAGPQGKAPIAAEATSESQQATIIDEKPSSDDDHNDTSREPVAKPSPTDR